MTRKEKAERVLYNIKYQTADGLEFLHVFCALTGMHPQHAVQTIMGYYGEGADEIFK